MGKSFDVIVVGGGVIGSLITRRLGRAGRSVLLLESGAMGEQSSGAAAGMLGAQLEIHEPGPLYRLGVESRARFKQLSDALLDETGVDIELVNNGILRVAGTPAEEQELKDSMQWQLESGQRCQWVDAADVAHLEPCLAAHQGGVLLPDDGNVLAPRLAQAAALAASRVAVVRADEAVSSVVKDGPRVLVRTIRDTYSANVVVVAAGAWSDEVLGTRGLFHARPVKGQMFSLRPTPGVRLQRTIYRHGAVYLVPKRDGTIVVGATMEPEAGYHREVTIGALQKLSTALGEVAPGLVDAHFERAWTGLRPMVGTGQPIVGPLPEEPHIILATGHLRNGVLLAPSTAEAVASYVEGVAPGEDWAAFLPPEGYGVAAGSAV